MVEPNTCVPSAVLTMPATTPAAEPLLDPPGVRRRSWGLRVPRGSVEANSVVTVFPTMTAPASRSAATLAPSRSEPEAGEQRRAVFGRHVGGLDDVLDADRHAVNLRARPA